MKSKHEQDNIYANPLNHLNRFTFDNQVVRVFPDMIKRSIPGYAIIINMIGELAGRYSQHKSVCYDLGCSLGAATLAMRHHVQTAHCRIVGVDNSVAMIERCQQIIDMDNGSIPVDLICENLQNIVLANASVVVLNFTLQFIPLEERQQVLQNIYRGLNPGGMLILSEKIAFKDRQQHQLMIELHHNFKRANGYSDLEIAQKRTALENVLIPETLDSHRDRLEHCGFNSANVWFQCFNFASLIAIK